jgi:hypothetical protein
MDVYPYINGKCLLSGVDLKEMEAIDMLDVLHYLFESDSIVRSQEEFDSKQKVREIIYPMIYNEKYAYNKQSSTPNYDFDSMDFSDEDTNFSPTKSNSVKPYMPPTDFNADAQNPFGSALRETPLG